MAQSKTSSLIVKFVIVGIATLILDTTVTTLLYKHGHLPAGVASAIGFTSGFLVNFIGNRGVVFKSVEGYHFKRKSQILMYVVLVFFNLAFTSLMTEVLVSRAGVKHYYSKNLPWGACCDMELYNLSNDYF